MDSFQVLVLLQPQNSSFEKVTELLAGNLGSSFSCKGSLEDLREFVNLDSNNTGAMEYTLGFSMLEKLAAPSSDFNAIAERELLISQEKQLEDLESSLKSSMISISNLRIQNDERKSTIFALTEELQRIKEQTLYTIWEFLPERLKEFQSIPKIDPSIKEDDDRIGPYVLDEALGEGHFACVYGCHFDPDPSSASIEREKSLSKSAKGWAVKIIEKEKVTDVRGIQRINDEIVALLDPKLKHPNILAAVDVFHTPQNLYFITERGGKDLFDYFNSQEAGLPEKTINKVLSQIIPALQHLHSQGYCHRDLKPENILIGENEEDVTIVDLGLSVKIDKKHPLTDFCGSPGFFAPEILLEGKYDGKKADVWSVGSIILEMVLGHELFISKWMSVYDYSLIENPVAFRKTLERTLDEIYSILDTHPAISKLSSQFKVILKGMLAMKPSERLSADDITLDGWIETSAKLSSRSSSSKRCKTPRLQRAPSACSTPSRPGSIESSRVKLPALR